MTTPSDATKTYTLTALIPPKIPSRFSTWAHRISHPVDYSPSNYNPERDFRIGNGNPKYANPSAPPPSHDVDEDHIPGMKVRTVKILGRDFPVEFRCSHVLGGRAYECVKGCYVLERSGESERKCGAEEGKGRNEGCEGHRWIGYKKKNETGWCCFGERGVRLVCIQR